MRFVTNKGRWLIGGTTIAVAAAVVFVLTGGMSRSGPGNSTESAAADSSGDHPAVLRTMPDGALPRKSGTATAAPAVSVTVAPVAVRPIQRTVNVVGSFAGYAEVTVMAEVSGRVVRIRHDVGDLVRPGDVLLEIDPSDYQLAVEETRRSLELEATRVGLPIPPEEDFNPEQILAKLGDFKVDTLPAVLRAREQEENAQRRAERAKQLRRQNAISDESYEQIDTDFEVATNNRVQAELDARAVLVGIKYRLVLLKIAEKKLQDTNVVVPRPTPQEGLPDDVVYAVAKRKVAEGEMLKDSPGASTATFDLVIDKSLKLVGTVPERYASEVKVGQDVRVRVDAYPDRVFEGKVWRLSPTVDRLSRTFEVEVLVPNPRRELMAGGFAEGEILIRVDPEALVVPLEAVVSYAGTTKVFVVRDGTARAVMVNPGVEGRGWIELVNPDPKEIARRSLVITSGQNQLADGTPVAVRQPETSGQRPAASGEKGGTESQR